MKSNAFINRSLFHADNLSSDAITSGIMICHPIIEQGEYDGVVIKQGRESGYFRVVCKEAIKDTQADIDLYKIDINLKKDYCSSEKLLYQIRPGGFVVLHASFGDGKYQVGLSGGKREDHNNEYSTANLQKGDVVLAMLLQPGQFEMAGYRQQRCKISVEVVKSEEEYQKISSGPVNIKINDKGFSQQEIKLTQGQGLVISFETEGGLNIKLGGSPAVKDGGIKKHNWESVKYKHHLE